MATREDRRALENAWNEWIGPIVLHFKDKDKRFLSWPISVFIRVHLCKYLTEAQVSDIATRILERPNNQTDFAAFMESLDDILSRRSGSGSETWKMLFDEPFLDPDGAITSYALERLDECVFEYYRESTCYAPFVSIVQSSGWGKSKLIKHLASQGILVFYFSLMTKSSGYPQADPDIANVLIDIREEDHAYAVFCACLEWLHEQDGVPDREEFFLQQQDMRWPQQLKQKIIDPKFSSKRDMQQAFRNVWQKFASLSVIRNGVSILFVVDEARQLLLQQEGVEMPFTILRRASSAFIGHDGTPSSGALVVVIDAFGRASHLAPRNVDDPSARVALGRTKLFTPISSFPSFNVYMEGHDDVKTLDDASVPLTLFSRGRPLWGAAIRHDEGLLAEDVIRTNLLDLAETKLMGGERNDTFWEEPKSSLAVLGRRIAVEVCPEDKVTEELVASHMQVCLYTSASRAFMLTTVLPEPVLAEAAARMLNSSSRVAQQLQHLNSCMLKGLVSAGERGELVAGFLLLNTMDSLKSTYVIKPQRLEKFLGTLTKGKWPGFGSQAAHLKEARVFFNAFYPYFGREVTRQTLQEFLRNAAALIFRQGQRAYDLCIPFVTPDESGAYVLNDKHVHFLAIQVKNRKEIVNSTNVLQSMSNHALSVMLSGVGVPPAVFLLLQLGENESEGYCLFTEDEKQISIALEGLNAAYYDANWKESLLALLREMPHPKSVLESDGASNADIEAVCSTLKQLYDPGETQEPAGKGKCLVTEDTAAQSTGKERKRGGGMSAKRKR